jgi:hypothetical protein
MEPIVKNTIQEPCITHAEEGPMPKERVRLAASGSVNAAGRFEVDAITAGEGNGWRFSETCLQESLPLWDGVECFVDHSGWFTRERSVRDLGGVFKAPRWAEDTKGIRLELHTSGPSGALVSELGLQMLIGDGPKPKVGFSADVMFTAKGKEVLKILRVFSLDLVFNPARGGAFKRALNSVRKDGHTMSDETNTNENVSASQGFGTEHRLTQELESVRTLLGVQQGQEKLRKEAEKAQEIRASMCGYLLDSGLTASRLPAAMQESLRARFAGKAFEPAELAQAIEDARKLVSDLTAGAVVSGPGRVHGMFSSEDQLQAAVDDLFGVEREPALKDLKAARLQGIRELYLMLTGDDDLHGGYYPSRLRLATTSDFTGLVKNALNKIVVSQWEALGRAGYLWWQPIATVEHFNTLNGITGTLVGTVGTLPSVAEGGEYTELMIGDSPETASFTKYGGYIPLTLELIDRDETRKLKAYPRELANAGLRKLSALVAAIFTDNSGVGPTLADTGALFNATAVTTAGGHANLLTTALAAAEWEVVSQAVYNQPMLIKNATGYYGTGPKMAINPRYCLVPRKLKLTAEKILYPSWENAANIHSENLQRGITGDVLVVPEWTDATDWAAACDPAIAPAIFVGERFGIMPEVFVARQELSPAVFMNDEHRIKVRHFLAVWVNDFRPLHKSNVGG